MTLLAFYRMKSYILEWRLFGVWECDFYSSIQLPMFGKMAMGK